nr:hypothetical protein [uncultured Flavobacterium sp.]
MVRFCFVVLLNVFVLISCNHNKEKLEIDYIQIENSILENKNRIDSIENWDEVEIISNDEFHLEANSIKHFYLNDVLEKIEINYGVPFAEEFTILYLANKQLSFVLEEKHFQEVKFLSNQKVLTISEVNVTKEEYYFFGNRIIYFSGRKFESLESLNSFQIYKTKMYIELFNYLLKSEY